MWSIAGRIFSFIGTHARFFQTMQEQGINVCLGTDSMASNDSLNMLDEMQQMAQVFPRLSAQELLKMATVNAAKALNQVGKLGKITPGAWADLMRRAGRRAWIPTNRLCSRTRR